MKKKTRSIIATAIIACSGFMVWSCNQSDWATLEQNETEIQSLQNEVESPEFMPLNTVPERIKKTLTEEEYQAWKRLSSRYKIDYSILSQYLTAEQKSDLYQYINTLWEQSLDSIGNKPLGYFTVITKSPVKRIENLQYSESGTSGISGTSGPYTIFQANGVDASVKATVSYTLNSEGTAVSSASANAYGSGVACISYEGSCTCSPQTTAVIISCSGTLRYRLNDNTNGETSEDFSEQVTAKILL